MYFFFGLVALPFLRDILHIHICIYVYMCICKYIFVYHVSVDRNPSAIYHAVNRSTKV